MENGSLSETHYKSGIVINSLRQKVRGFNAEPPTPEEIEELERIWDSGTPEEQQAAQSLLEEAEKADETIDEIQKRFEGDMTKARLHEETKLQENI